MIEERPWVWNGNRMRDIHRSHDQIWDTQVSTTTWRDHLIVLHRLQIIVMVLNCKCADRRKCRNGNKLIAEGAKSLPLLLLQNVWKSPLPPAPPSPLQSWGYFSPLVLPVITQIDLSLAPISSSAPRHRAEYYANLGNQQSQPTSYANLHNNIINYFTSGNALDKYPPQSSSPSIRRFIDV